MHQTGSRSEAEVDTTLGSAYVNIFNLSAFAEMFHYGGAVEHCVYLGLNTVGEVVGDVAEHYLQTIAEKLVVSVLEIVEQQQFETMFGCVHVFVAHQTVNLLGVRVYQLLQHMYAQIACGTGEQHIAKRLAAVVAEHIQVVVFQHIMNRLVIVVGAVVLVGASHRDTCHQLGQLARRRVGEHIAIGHVNACLVGLNDDTGHHERGAAQFEEVVGGTDLVHSDNVFEDAAEQTFGVVSRLNIFVVGSLNHRRRQSLAVNLLVLVERYGVDLHGCSRYHVRRLLLSDERVQFLDFHLFVTDDVGSYILTTILIIKGLHSDILYARELSDDSLHLLHLHTEAANLHLTVLTAHKLNVAVRLVADYVARTIDTAILRRVVERVFQIGFSRLFWTVQIASAYLRSADPQFACRAHRESVELFVNYIELEVVQWLAYWEVYLVFLQLVVGGENGAFRRAVAVKHPVGRRGERRQFFASYGEATQRMIIHIGGKLEAHLGGHEGMRYIVFVEIFIQIGKVETDVVAHNVDAGAASQSGIHIHHAGVEAIAGVGCHTVVGSETVIALIPMTEGHQVAVLQLTALRRACGTRGVKQDEQARWRNLSGQLAVDSRQLFYIFGKQHLTLIFIHQLAQFLIGYEQLGVGVFHHEIQTLCRIARVERLIGATGLKHTQGGYHHPLAARNEHRHHILRRQALRLDVVGYTFGYLIHFFVGVFIIVIYNSLIVRSFSHLTAEQRHYVLGVVVFHFSIVEAVKHRNLVGVEQRYGLQCCLWLSDEGVGGVAHRLCQALHKATAVAAVVVLYAHARLALLVVGDEEGYAELRSVRLKSLYADRLAFVPEVVEYTQLIGKHYLGREVVVGCYLGERIFLVL